MSKGSKVWVVFFANWSNYNLLEVFTSKDKAIKYIKERITKKYKSYDIEEGKNYVEVTYGFDKDGHQVDEDMYYYLEFEVK